MPLFPLSRIILFICLTTAMACGNDDDGGSGNFSENIAGSYEGSISGNFVGDVGAGIQSVGPTRFNGMLFFTGTADIAFSGLMSAEREFIIGLVTGGGNGTGFISDDGQRITIRLNINDPSRMITYRGTRQ
ncbi:MAG: hypothetical protein AAF433_22855 [Bacteroidota bacterium]